MSRSVRACTQTLPGVKGMRVSELSPVTDRWPLFCLFTLPAVYVLYVVFPVRNDRSFFFIIATSFTLFILDIFVSCTLFVYLLPGSLTNDTIDQQAGKAVSDEATENLWSSNVQHQSHVTPAIIVGGNNRLHGSNSLSPPPPPLFFSSC